ncbi:hypothetical protein [uncultured Erythrobacter sp.]|uniref:hypothetical protein n=1 Tax=uncultured Erythrobacter sp. TaxID=263913 RepID=UPI00261106CF|nr:hypothetical protein [uncultured Erythrobacter sp.]
MVRISPQGLAAAGLANRLRRLLADEIEEDEWVDFASTPLPYPELDNIRTKAASLAIPLDTEERSIIRGLIDDVAALQANEEIK